MVWFSTVEASEAMAKATQLLCDAPWDGSNCAQQLLLVMLFVEGLRTSQVRLLYSRRLVHARPQESVASAKRSKRAEAFDWNVYCWFKNRLRNRTKVGYFRTVQWKEWKREGDQVVAVKESGYWLVGQGMEEVR